MTPKPDEHGSAPPTEEDVRVLPKDENRVVISGMAGLYPNSRFVKDLENILYNKINPISSEELRWKYNHPEATQYAGSVPDLDRFDAQFFKVHYRLGNNMDSMSRKMLEQAYEAIYDSGISPEHLSGKKVGVYVGSCFSETEKACFYAASTRRGFGIAGCSKAMFANRISYWLNAKGPSVSIDDACCSSTAALEQAYKAITRGECESAIVGGANLCLHPQSSVHYGRIMNISMDGKTKSFAKDAFGCAKSEAINVLFLQKAKDAKRIYANLIHVKTEFVSIVKEETGPKYGFYRDPADTVNFLNTFYDEAGIPPSIVEYVEAFGSAVPEADKSELVALDRVFCKDKKDPLLVGSVMSNIGYGEAASGISAVTKVLLGYNRGELAGNLNCESVRTDIEAIQEGRIRILTDNQRFQGTYTAVNSISVTGVNGHVLLYGHNKQKDLSRYTSNIPHLVTISGRQDSSVVRVFNHLKSHPIDPEELALLHNIHETNISGHLGKGFIILDTNPEQKTISLCERANYFDNAQRPLWFVYSGMGSQWAGMGAQLMRIPIFSAAIERCRKVLEPKGIDIVHIITSPDKTIYNNILNSFVGIAAVQIGLTDVLLSLGLVPDKIIGSTGMYNVAITRSRYHDRQLFRLCPEAFTRILSVVRSSKHPVLHPKASSSASIVISNTRHSVGELGCAYADGCLTAEEMILSSYSRGLVSLETPFISGSMAAIGMGFQQMSKMCPPEIVIACHNSAESCTISGPADAMRIFVADLTAKGIFAKEVPCSNIAYHSRYIADAGPGLLKYLKAIIKTPKIRSEKWVSTSVPQDKWTESTATYSSAEYHTNNLLSPVLFEEASKLIPPNAVLIEVAPHALLQAILKRSLPNSCTYIPLTRRGHQDNVVMVLEAIGKLYMEGYNPKIQALYPKVEFPVSVGTPYLSHYADWAHHEKWSLPLYESALRKMAASCTFAITVHDPEYEYLKGHVIQNKTLLPFSFVLVAAWDTLAMSLNTPKKSLSVVFQDVQFYVQPRIYDQKQVKLSVSLHRGNGRFEIMDEISKVASGYIINQETDVEEQMKESRSPSKRHEISNTDMYQIFYEKEYTYSGEFCSIHSSDESLSEAYVLWKDNWVTFIDSLLQLNMLKYTEGGVSQPDRIGRIVINVKKHITKVDLNETNDNKVILLKAELSDVQNRTRCGGVSLEHIRFHKLIQINNEQTTLQTLKFIPRFQSNIDLSSSLRVFLQIVAENKNKDIINVIGFNLSGSQIYHEIENICKENDIPGVKINYQNLSKLHNNKDMYDNVDLIVIKNLSNNENICEKNFYMVKKDTFILNEEDLSLDVSRIFQSTMLSIVSVLKNARTQIGLAYWRPTQQVTNPSIFTIKSESDVSLLEHARNNLTPQSSLIVFSSYPAVAGLIRSVKLWRQDAAHNRINLIMINETSKENLCWNENPNENLAYNIYNDGLWGSEYYLPTEESSIVAKNIMLQSDVIGDIKSLSWVQAPLPAKTGVLVTVHYTGINFSDVKKAHGTISIENNQGVEGKSYGLEFSGLTESGERVMGITRNGAAQSQVTADPELLWPVPSHWSLEDAATVPFAYLSAYLCLTIKPGLRIAADEMKQHCALIHGGAGALGQAAISIALSNGYKVFTTVSDLDKKRFLMKLFPELIEENIGNSRDSSFGELVLSATNGRGCNVVLCCLKGELKDTSLRCCGLFSLVLDTSQILNHENYTFGMSNLSKGGSYIAVDINNILNNTTSEEYQMLHGLISEGIALGHVRPLSRVIYSPQHVSRAFQLLATSRHRGRVLLKINESLPSIRPRISFDENHCHAIVCGEFNPLGLQLADKLIDCGATKLHLHFNSPSACLRYKLRIWERRNIRVTVSFGILTDKNDVTNLMNKVVRSGPVEGLYVIATSALQETVVTNLDLATRTICPTLKYFLILSDEKSCGYITSVQRIKTGLPVTFLDLAMLKKSENRNGVTWYHGAVEAAERALKCKEEVLIARQIQLPQTSLVHQIASLTDLEISDKTSSNASLETLGMPLEKSYSVCALLKDVYNVYVEEKDIPLLTLERIKEIEAIMTEPKFEEVKGLQTFFSYVDPDELLATTEIMILPTLTNSSTMRDDEFDVNETFLCIVPGLEGHYERFRALCERLKLSAFVLQPGLDRLEETPRELAIRYSKVLLKRSGHKEKFYILGYETGIIVALELAAILEESGKRGTVFCLGDGPEETNALVELEVKQFETEEALQMSVLRHMFALMACGSVAMPESVLTESLSWRERVDTCVRTLLGRMSHSAQYARMLIEAAYTRIKNLQRYVFRPLNLRSKIVLLRAHRHTSGTNSDEECSLQRYSLGKIIVQDLNAPLAHATLDLRVPAIINSYLDDDIKQAYKERNCCDTYLINADAFMTISDRSK